MKINFTGVESSNSVPVGQYRATIYNIEYKEAKAGGYPGYNWTFLVQDGPHKGRKAFAFSSLAPQALFRLKSFLEVLTDEPLTGDFDFDPRQFLGRKVLITVVKSKDPKYNDSVEKLQRDEGQEVATSTVSSNDPPAARMF